MRVLLDENLPHRLKQLFAEKKMTKERFDNETSKLGTSRFTQS